MKLVYVLAAFSTSLAAVEACSSPSDQSDGGNDATNDVAQNNDAALDVTPDVSQNDASDGGCPAAWLALPDLGDASLEVPDGGGVILHAAGSGTQNYTCEATDAGYVWTFVGPQANLDDCNGTLIGHHFASEAGAAAPEWETLDNSYVIAKKQSAYTANATSVPWLLLQETSNGGTGIISHTLYVQRLYTDGGDAPTSTCDDASVGTMMNEPYTADYYFYGN